MEYVIVSIAGTLVILGAVVGGGILLVRTAHGTKFSKFKFSAGDKFTVECEEHHKKNEPPSPEKNKAEPTANEREPPAKRKKRSKPRRSASQQ